MASVCQGVGLVNCGHILTLPLVSLALLSSHLLPSGQPYKVSSIAPSISGEYTVDIKKALCCQLVGGSRKILPDGMKLRGDINVLLLVSGACICLEQFHWQCLR